MTARGLGCTENLLPVSRWFAFPGPRLAPILGEKLAGNGTGWNLPLGGTFLACGSSWWEGARGVSGPWLYPL